jgi:protein phosphatase methylesterase 1
LLILAGTDRLDKELMIGQMMGKYQLVVCPEAGHFVHEDEAGRVAVSVRIFPLSPCRR